MVDCLAVVLFAHIVATPINSCLLSCAVANYPSFLISSDIAHDVSMNFLSLVSVSGTRRLYCHCTAMLLLLLLLEALMMLLL